MNRLLSIWCDVILLWHAIEMYTTEQYTGGLLMPRYISRQKITSQDRGGLKQCKETPEPLTTWLICSIYSSLTLSCSCCTWSDLLDTESKTQQRSSHTHTQYSFVLFLICIYDPTFHSLVIRYKQWFPRMQFSVSPGHVPVGNAGDWLRTCCTFLKLRTYG